MPTSFRYRLQIHDHPAHIDPVAWDGLLNLQALPTPFMRHAYLQAMHASGSAVPAQGWTPRFMLLWQEEARAGGAGEAEEEAEEREEPAGQLVAACAVYLKTHSYGEYVFDWAWANAYAEHGLRYYPKALVAAPFTPVPGSRLLARDAVAREALVRGLVQWCSEEGLSSLHVLYGDEADRAACESVGLMNRHQVQFHWNNATPAFESFDAFLASLNQEKRKKIRQERRKVRDAGVSFRWARGADISPADWAFFYQCYERTYLEHGNAPYLTPEFFDAMARDMPENWLLFIAQDSGGPMACSLIALNSGDAFGGTSVAYGRYWGALKRGDSLHFEACYYQPIEWCIAHGVSRFEGGAQGEHKMARALMPVRTQSAHWLAHPAFADAVERFLEREGQGVDQYMEHLERRSPFRQENGAGVPTPPTR